MRSKKIASLIICLVTLVVMGLIFTSCAPDTETTLTKPVTTGSSSSNNTAGKSFTTGDAILGLVATGNDLWATTSSGVICWNLENGKERKYTTQDGLGSDKTREIIRDSQGNIWVTCYVNGVSRFNGDKWESFTVKNGLCSNETITLAADKKGGVWVSAYWGVSYFDGNQWSSYSNVDPNGLVVGGPNPMKDCQNLTFVDVELAAADVIFVDSRGDVWFSSRGRGVTRYDGKEWRLFTSKDGLGAGGVYTFFEDKNGVIWFDSSTGMISFDGVKFTYISIPAYQSVIPRPIAQDILQDNDGNLWLAAYGGGVAKFDGKDWQAFTVQDGLVSINAQDLFLNKDGYPCVITDKGVSRFDGSAWKIMTAADGLPEGKVRVVVNDDKGNLWFGTEGGVSYYIK
jgi:ligand-binding sensor domain-containing protein